MPENNLSYVKSYGLLGFTNNSDLLCFFGVRGCWLSGGQRLSTSLAYDPLDRLERTTTGGVTTRFLYDGADIVGEYDGSGTLLRRYFNGPDGNEPMLWYEGAVLTNRRFLSADERGSITAVTNDAGAVLGRNAFDTFGAPAPTNLGLFGYAGQPRLPGGLWNLRARAYHPALGRLLQPDPIGMAGGMNLYAYAGNDPLNFVDPWGLQAQGAGGGSAEMVVTANRRQPTLVSAPCLFQCAKSGGTGDLLHEFSSDNSSGPSEEVEDDQATYCPIVLTPHGDTKGDKPRFDGHRYNTSLDGDWSSALAIFRGLSALAGYPWPNYTTLPLPHILARSHPSGVQLRMGKDLKPRIDIPAGAIHLSIPETIHFSGKGSAACPQ